MNLFPDNWGSALWGAVVVALLWFISSFFGAAGRDAWGWTKRKVLPSAPDPIKVPDNFEPEKCEPDSWRWVREKKLSRYEGEGYTYYVNSENGARVFREVFSGHIKYIEWLMLRPDAKT